MTTRELRIGQQTLSLETGKLAKQAHGSVIVRFGDSVVLVTACHAAAPARRHRLSAADGRLPGIHLRLGPHPGGFFKREGKPAEKEVLTSRCIDRPTRPLFPAGWRFETQIIALVLSADQENDTDVLAITGASAALALSDIPFQKTIAAVRMGLVDGQVHRQPDLPAAQREQARSHRRRQQGRPGDGGGGREGSDRGAGRRGARHGARGHQADRRRDRRPGQGSRQEEDDRGQEGNRPRLLPRGRRKRCSCR